MERNLKYYLENTRIITPEIAFEKMPTLANGLPFCKMKIFIECGFDDNRDGWVIGIQGDEFIVTHPTPPFFLTYDNLTDAVTELYDEFILLIGDVTPMEYENELHERAKELIDELGYSCSLDEIPLDVLNDKYQKRVTHLLNQFALI